MIRKILLSSVALIAISGTAFAADLPSRRAPPVFVPPPPPIFTWTGFYVGAQIGIAFGRDAETLYVPGNPEFGTAGLLVGRPNGLIGGGHVGYNFSSQSLPFLGGLAGGFGGGGLVVGIEGDIDGSDYRSQIISPFYQGFRSDIGGSLRGRVGIAAGRALFYATGGVALAEFQNTYGSAIGFDNDTHSRVGYTVGGGIEYALTTTFSLRAEYRYTDYGHYTDILAASADGLIGAEHHIVQNRAQVGFSYKFESPMAPPVVARY